MHAILLIFKAVKHQYNLKYFIYYYHYYNEHYVSKFWQVRNLRLPFQFIVEGANARNTQHTSYTSVSISHNKHYSHLLLWAMISYALTHWGPKKWSPFSRRYFKVHFRVWFIFKFFIQISLKFVAKDPNDNKPLASNSRQAIIWINDGLVFWRMYASLGDRWFQEDFLPRLNTPCRTVSLIWMDSRVIGI